MRVYIYSTLSIYYAHALAFMHLYIFYARDYVQDRVRGCRE